MRRWPVITEFNEEKRLIGGEISVRQLVYILFGFTMAGGAVLLFWDIFLVLGFILAMPCIFLGFLFGFYEKDGLKFDEWVLEEIQFYFSQKTYISED